MGLTRIRADQISNIDYKQAVRVITLSNITLSGGAPDTVDNVSLSAGDRILVAGQSTGSQNGIYVVSTLGTGSNGTWARSADGNENGEIEAGMIIMVTEGDVYKDTQWKLTTNNPIVIGTTALVFEQNSAFAFGNVYANGTAVLATSVGDALTLTAGNNIAITGNNTSKTVTIGVTGISLNSISNGTSNVNVISSGGNVTVGVGGTNNIAVFSTAGVDVTGRVSATGNITGGNLSGTSISGTLTTAAQTNITSVGTLSSLSVSGNIQGGNLRTTGLISATGTVTGSTFVGAVAATTVSTSGNVTGGNILTGGLISATGNITGGNLSGTNIAGTLTTAAQTNITSVGTLSSLSVTGNITGGNISTAGELKSTGTFVIGTQQFYAQGSDGFSVNENFNAGNANVTAYHYTSGAGRNAIVFDTAVTGQFTTGFGTTGTAASNKFVFFAEFGNTFWEWRKSVGISAPNLNGGTLLANISADGNLWTAGTITGTGNVTGGNLITAGTVSSATLTTTGNAIIGGNLTVNGNTIYVNITDLNVQDPIIGLGRGANNTPLSSDDGKDRGEQLWYYTSAEKSAFIGYDNSADKLIAALDVSITDEIVTVNSYGNFVVGGLEAATGAFTGNVSTGNIAGTTGTFTNVDGTLTTAAQTNITSVGTLTSLSVSGNVQGGNIRTAGLVSATGTVTGSTFLGNLSGTTVSASGNVTGGNLLTGGLISATANITGGNLLTGGLISATGNITGGNILGNGAGLDGINVFSNITVSGGNSVVANSIADTLTLTGGDGITLVADAGNNIITIATAGTGDSIFATGGDMGTVDEAVTAEEDLGLVTDTPAATEIDMGTIVTGGILYPDQLVLPAKTVADLANLSATPAGQFVFCSDESGGSIPAFSDGTNWRRVSDRAIVT